MKKQEAVASCSFFNGNILNGNINICVVDIG